MRNIKIKSNIPSYANLYRVQITFNGFDVTGEEIPEFISAKTELEAKKIIKKYCDDVYSDWADEVVYSENSIDYYVYRVGWAEWAKIQINKLY